MLDRKYCPHTGVVNYFCDEDPFLAVGSVVRVSGPASYHWRCYVGMEPIAGAAGDLRAAERQLLSHYGKLPETPLPAVAA